MGGAVTPTAIPATVAAATAQKRRAFWLKHLHRWHWISAATCLIVMLLFSITGITLNHAASIASKPVVTMKEGELPSQLRSRLEHSPESKKAPLPAVIEEWISRQLDVHTAGRDGEWSDDEVYVSLPRAGGDAWLTIDRGSGAVQYERTDRGWISWLNDLHKGRNTGVVWSAFIDVFAASCVLFAGTGLLLLKMHSGMRPGTWPLVVLGFVLPAVLLLLFVH